MMKMKNPPHPGGIVATAIESEAWSIEHAANLLAVEPSFLSQVVKGQANINAALAIGLESVGWSDAEHWLRIQASYDLAQERKRKAS